MPRIHRLRPEARKEQILLTALELARRGHHLDITRKRVADILDISPPLINRYFDSQRKLQDAVYFLAVDREVVEVVAQRIPPGGHINSNLRKKLKKYLERILKK